MFWAVEVFTSARSPGPGLCGLRPWAEAHFLL